MTTSVWEFGRFRLHAGRRVLERDGKALKLSGPAFDMLLALIAQPGAVVSSDELLKIVWPDTEVDKVSIRVQMSGLRKALGQGKAHDRIIINVSGKGYRFVAPIRKAPPADGGRPLARQPVPPLVVRVIGRAGFVGEAVDGLLAGRLQTIVGPAGVGKTTAALSIATAVRDLFEDGVFFVDLAQIADPAHLPKALTSAVGVARFSDEPVSDLCAYLADRNALLILDNCEHLIAAVAALVGRLSDAAPGLKILATSRQPLHAGGELVRRLEPLASPSPEQRLTFGEILSFPAVELFVERSRAAKRDFAATAENVASIVELCRKLDGIPLAIEFAASRVEEFGLEGVAERIGDSFLFLDEGRRTALPRHATLMRALDWSYGLLSPAEALVLRRLSVFPAGFPIEAAEAIAGTGLDPATSVAALVASLVSKSMLSVMEEGGTRRYRLLEMTREFAAIQLSQSGEFAAVAHAHARHALDVLKDAEGQWGDGLSQRWLQRFGYRVEDARRAMAWALASAAHVSLAVELIVHSSVLFTSLGLVDEHRMDLERGIAKNAALPDPSPAMDAVMYSALGNVLYQLEGHLGGQGAREAFQAAAAAARRAESAALEVRALSGLSATYLIDGRYLDAVALSGDLVRAGGETDHAVHRTLAHSHFYAGKLVEAKHHLDATLANSPAGKDIRSAGAQFDIRMVTARATLALYLYVTGKPDSALAVVNDCLDDSAIFNHPIPLCHLAASSSVIAFNVGGEPAARRLLDLLEDTASSYSLGMWTEWATGFNALLVPRRLRRQGPAEQAVRRLMDQGVHGARANYYAVLGEGFTEPWLVEQSCRQRPGWCYPENIRVKAEFDLLRTGDGEAAAAAFRQAIDLSRQSGMLTWELRAAISLSKHGAEADRPANAKMLADIMSRFTEGFGSNDFREALALVEPVGRTG